MDRNEKLAELISRAKNLGLRFEFDSGLVTVTLTGPTNEPYRHEEVIKELSKFLPELRKRLELRAISVRANALVGQRLWSPEFGEGTVASGDAGLGLTASFQKEGARRPQTIGVSAGEVLIILDKKTGANPTPVDSEAKSEEPAKGFFGQLLRRAGEN
jgi:hypothetical protein